MLHANYTTHLAHGLRLDATTKPMREGERAQEGSHMNGEGTNVFR